MLNPEVDAGFSMEGTTLASELEFSPKNIFPRQSLKIFTFCVKLTDSIFLMFGHSPIVKLI